MTFIQDLLNLINQYDKGLKKQFNGRQPEGDSFCALLF